jgi:hypothetical protein
MGMDEAVGAAALTPNIQSTLRLGRSLEVRPTVWRKLTRQALTHKGETRADHCFQQFY